MHYMGGKTKSVKYILPILNKALQELGSDAIYLEPFCGACNVVQYIQAKTRICSDIHNDLILMWKAAQEGTLEFPSCISEEDYYALRKAPPSALRGFVGFACGFGGKFLGTYARQVKGKDWRLSRSYIKGGEHTLKQKLIGLRGVTFYHADYKQWRDTIIRIPGTYLIYCDPPYAGTAKYDETPDFNHDAFWEEMRKWSSYGHKVFISEMQAPKDFVPVWQGAVRRDMASAFETRKDVSESLFVWKGK